MGDQRGRDFGYPIAHGVFPRSKGEERVSHRVRRDNHFNTEGSTSAPLDELEAELKDRLDSGRGGCGSLNTTFHYADESDAAESAVPLLDGLMHRLDDLQLLHADPSSWRLNHRLYLIWKLQGYCTPYHQDVHVPPHFTLYNQVDGVSTFHFLPLLAGLFATHVGRRSADELAVLLQALRERGVGELATLGPKQMLLIYPSGAHGVFVPRTTLPANAPLPKFDFSVIRAAEIFAWPTHEHYDAADVGGRRRRGVVLLLTHERRGEGGGGAPLEAV